MSETTTVWYWTYTVDETSIELRGNCQAETAGEAIDKAHDDACEVVHTSLWGNLRLRYISDQPQEVRR